MKLSLHGNLYLIGLMGAGKSTVGRVLARLIGRDFIDTDRAIETKTGVSVSHIFELEGEQGFREREVKMLAEIAATATDAVVATGGGVILRQANRRVMRTGGGVVYLRASAELLTRRLCDSDSRPLLDGAPADTLARLLQERGPLYAAEADWTFDISAQPAAQLAVQIADAIGAPLRHDQR